MCGLHGSGRLSHRSAPAALNRLLERDQTKRQVHQSIQFVNLRFERGDAILLIVGHDSPAESLTALRILPDLAGRLAGSPRTAGRTRSPECGGDCLLVSESDDRIDLRRSSRRDIAGRAGDREEQQRDGRKRRHVEGCDAVQQPCNHPRQRERGQQSGGQPCTYQRQLGRARVSSTLPCDVQSRRRGRGAWRRAGDQPSLRSQDWRPPCAPVGDGEPEQRFSGLRSGFRSE